MKHKWAHDQVSPAQVNGQLLVWSEQTNRASTAHQRHIERLESEIVMLKARGIALAFERPGATLERHVATLTVRVAALEKASSGREE